jgi:hypothetical protein
LGLFLPGGWGRGIIFLCFDAINDIEPSGKASDCNSPGLNAASSDIVKCEGRRMNLGIKMKKYCNSNHKKSMVIVHLLYHQ